MKYENEKIHLLVIGNLSAPWCKKIAKIKTIRSKMMLIKYENNFIVYGAFELFFAIGMVISSPLAFVSFDRGVAFRG